MFYSKLLKYVPLKWIHVCVVSEFLPPVSAVLKASFYFLLHRYLLFVEVYIFALNISSVPFCYCFWPSFLPPLVVRNWLMNIVWMKSVPTSFITQYFPNQGVVFYFHLCPLLWLQHMMVDSWYGVWCTHSPSIITFLLFQLSTHISSSFSCLAILKNYNNQPTNRWLRWPVS